MKIDVQQKINFTENPGAKLGRKLSLALKYIGFSASVVIALAASGCASQPPIALDAVGPAPTMSASTAADHGALIVYSPCVSVADLDAEISGQTSDDWEYSGYKILSLDGKRIKSVSNNAGTVQLHPQKVELPVGRYVVLAKAENGLRVTVPVVIASRQATVLHLDGNDFQPSENGFNQTNTVHLPDGRIVGWRAVTKDVPTS